MIRIKGAGIGIFDTVLELIMADGTIVTIKDMIECSSPNLDPQTNEWDPIIFKVDTAKQKQLTIDIQQQLLLQIGANMHPGRSYKFNGILTDLGEDDYNLQNGYILEVNYADIGFGFSTQEIKIRFDHCSII